jgi:hypothetical protein
MLTLALVLSLQTWHLVALALVVAGAFGHGYFAHRGWARAERGTRAVIAGAKAFVADMELGKDDVVALEDAFRAGAKEYGVEDHVEEHIGDGLAVPAPPRPIG